MNTDSLSLRVKSIEESKSLQVSGKIRQLISNGQKVHSLIVGEPTEKPHKAILEATKKALDEGKTGYSNVAGEIPLLKEISLHYQKNGWDNLQPENIIISNGSKNSIYNIFQTICNQNDEVIVMTPYWVTFPESIKLAGGKPVFVGFDKNFYPNLDELKSKINQKTKAIIFNCPNNPSGAIYSKDVISELFKIAVDVPWIISDEAYDEVVFKPSQFTSPALMLPEYKDKIITVKSFSKSYALTGFRLGMTLANRELIKAMNVFQGHLCGNSCTFAQYGALEALKRPNEELIEYILRYQKRRDLCFKHFSPFFPELKKPEGAFYLFPKIDHLLDKKTPSCLSFCEDLLVKKNVAVLPGQAFGAPNHIRISFAASEEDIIEGAKKFGEYLKERN